MRKQTVRVGVIGCGSVAEFYHWCNWNRLQGARVTAVTDLRKDAAEAAGQRLGARVYDSTKALIGEADVDAIFLFLPPFAHGEPELLAIERGLPFFVEKPVALDLNTAQEIADAVRKIGLITSAGYQWRYEASVQAAKTMLASRKVALVHGYWLGSAAHRTTTPAWWRDRSLSGGQLLEQSTHMADLLRYFGGEVRRVYCHQVHRLVEGLGIPDAGAVLLHYASGAVGTLVNGCSLPKNNLRAGVFVVAEGIALEVTRGKVAVQRDGNNDEHTWPNGLDTDPYLLEDQTFIDAVRTGDASAIRSSYSDGVRTLALCLAADESSRTGEAVEIRA